MDEHGFAFASSGDRVRAAGQVVIVDDVIGTTGVEVPGEHDAGQHHVPHHRLHEHLVVRRGLAVAGEHPVDGAGDLRRQRRHVDDTQVYAGERVVPAVLGIGAGANHQRHLAKAAGDLVEDRGTVGRPGRSADDHLIAKPTLGEVRDQPFERRGLGRE